MRRKLLGIALLAAALAVGTAEATTFELVDEDCPVCDGSVQVMSIFSWGTYIYSWDSKYQFIFWPLTEDASVYCCGRCGLACLMDDFDEFSDEDCAKIEQVLPEPPKAAAEDEVEPFAGLSACARLQLAEKVYAAVDRDVEFWCHFYRVMGFHCELAGEDEQARTARQEALALAGELAADETLAGRRKEFLLISGAMHHFLGEDEPALADFAQALELEYYDEERGEEGSADADAYLTELLEDYSALVREALEIPKAGEALT